MHTVKILLLLALVTIAPGCVYAQNIEGQVVASEFGEFQVPTNGNGFTFPAAACQVSGGGKNFEAFSTGAPVKIVDVNPSLTEVVTPVAVFLSGACSVSLPAAYSHTSFYLTSGTGGLQEALLNARTRAGGPNTIILNAEWYALVAPGNPATVIATVTGGAGFGLVDVTTTPYTYYSWNGSQFVSVGTGGGGAPTGAAGGALSGTYPNPGLATGALPNGMTATTQTTGDGSNKVATDQFVASAMAAGGGASTPATSLILKGNGSANGVVAATPGTDYVIPSGSITGTAGNLSGTPTLPNGTKAATQATNPCDNTTNLATDAFVSLCGASGTVTPANFSGYGDAQSVINGCTTTASSTSVTCPTGTFTTGDVGKQIWFTGAGASGVAFNATIAAVASNTAITVSAAPPTSVTQTYTVYGHDDTSAIQACWNYSSANRAQCIMNSPTGYLEGSAGLQIMTRMRVTGNSYTQGSNIFCEYNGDCLSLEPGPDTGVNISNLEIWVDQSQPNGRGIHLNAATGQSVSFGGLFNSNLSNIQVENMANECLWLDGGGGAGYTYNLPNQYISFFQFNCNGPIQQHNPNMILATGQNEQIVFLNGATNGVSQTAANQTQYNLWLSYYPNPLISIHEKTNGLNDAPEDITFFNYTYEVGTQGLYISQSSDIHYDNSYVEGVPSPLIVQNSSGFTFNGNHVANSGTTTAVGQFGINSYGSFRDNYMVVSGSYTIPDLAVCTAPTYIDFSANVSPVTTTTGCATDQVSISGSTLTVPGTTEYMNGSATTVTNIIAPNVMPGKTLTLYAAGAITLGSGGNINFGGVPSPLTIPAGSSVTLQLFDLGPTWLLTSTTAGVGLLGGTQTWTGVNSFSYNTTSSAGGITLGPSGSIGTSFTQIYDDGTLHLDASSNTARSITISGNSGGTIANFRASATGANQVSISNAGVISSNGINSSGPVNASSLSVTSTAQVANLQAATAGNLAAAAALPNGTTATTQTASDSTTELATDAFVHAVSPLTQTANTSGFSVAGGTTSKTLTVNNSLTLGGTDGTTETFPGSSATLAGLGIAQSFTAAQTDSAAGVASTPGLTVSGAPYTAGSATTDFPQTYLNCSGATGVTTLSTAGTMFGVNACNGFTGHLINLFVNGGSTRFRVDYLGNTFVAGTETVASNFGLSATAAPTMAAGAAAGTSPTCTSVTGNNNAGVITCTTGTATTASATLATITFNGTLGTVPQGCSLMARNASTALVATSIYTTAPTSTSFTIGVSTTALPVSTTFVWSYICL